MAEPCQAQSMTPLLSPGVGLCVHAGVGLFGGGCLSAALGYLGINWLRRRYRQGRAQPEGNEMEPVLLNIEGNQAGL